MQIFGVNLIKFEFELEEVDAMNLFNVLQTAISDTNFSALESYSDYLQTQELIKLAEHDWFKAHAAYLQQILDKILAGQSK